MLTAKHQPNTEGFYIGYSLCNCLRGGLGFLLLSILLLQQSYSNDTQFSLEKGIVRFNETDWISGQLLNIKGGDRVLWKCPDFKSPLEIKLDSVWQLSAISEQALNVDYPPSTVRVELDNGDVIYGLLKSQADRGLELTTTSLGTIFVPNKNWLRMESVRLQDSESNNAIQSTTAVRSLTNQLVNSAVIPGWDRIPDGLVSNKHAATLRTDFGLQDRYRVDLRLAWSANPSFDIAIGIDPSEPSASTAVHLEVWDGQLVLAKQQDGKADASIVKALNAPSQPNNSPLIEISIFHDANTGVTFAADLNGNKLAQIQLPPFRSRRCTGIQVVNHGDKLRIESIRSAYWPREEERQVTINPAKANGDLKDRANDANPFTYVFLTDGSRITGEFGTSPEGKSILKAEWLGEDVKVPSNSIYRVVKDFQKVPVESERESYILNTTHTHLPIELSSFQRTDDFEKLAIKSSKFSSPGILVTQSSGEIRRFASAIYSSAVDIVKSGPTKGSKANSAQSSDVMQASVFRIPTAIQLQSGETLQGDVDNIDTEGVHFSSALTDSTLIKPEEILSVYLHPRKYPLPVDIEKMQRLMTLPRDQVEDMPANLLITTGGDYIRGEVIRLGDTSLEFRVNQDRLTIPRRNVSSIVWLRKKEASGTERELENGIQDAVRDPAKEPGSTNSPLLGEKLVHSSGTVDIDYFSEKSTTQSSLRIKINSIQSKTIRGTNDILGGIDLSETIIERIRFGKSSNSSSPSTNPWLLTTAAAPNFIGEDPKGDSGHLQKTGDSSPMVNMKAPLFQLKDLDGELIRLERFRGKVVVLNFWASWSGPSMEALPELSNLVSRFRSDICQWIGVNLQETRERASSVLSDLAPGSLILLDSNGVVANLYKVESIPVVIVIAPTGIIQSVFIGSNRLRLEEIEQSIRSCLAPK